MRKSKFLLRAPKVIADPVYGVFDVRPVLPMIETEPFQLLGDKKQLGTSYIVFPSATHTRRAHSLGSYHATRELAHHWLELGLINKDEALAMAAYALYHDIGHPAFSHVIEPLCPKNNDEMGLQIAASLREPIESCGVNFDLMMSLMSHRNPLYLAVHERNLGMEKLDYLERDGLVTILSRPHGIDYLRRHIYFIGKRLVIDEKVVDNATEAQNFYLRMYKNVYLRKASVVAQAMFEKIVYLMISAGEIRSEDLWNLTDSEVVGLINVSKNEAVKKLYHLFRCRDLFREAVVIRPNRFVKVGNTAGKAIATIGLTEGEMEGLITAHADGKKRLAASRLLEENIARALELLPEDILAVPVFSPWRFKPTDITIYHRNGEFLSLKERFPEHFRDMAEVSASYTAFRVCTLARHRRRVSSPKVAPKVVDLVLETAQKP